MVICIHSSLPNPIDAAVTAVSRAAVPVFLMITGYYYSLISGREDKQKKQIVKIAKLVLWSNTIYLVFDILIGLVQKLSLSETLSDLFSVKNLLKFFILNDSPFGVHLWYLGALLYALIIVFFWEKKWDRKKMYPVVPALLLLDLIFGKYSLLIIGTSIPYVILRNFLFVGLPYFLLGDMLYTYKPKFTTKKLLIYSAVFVVTSVLERLILTVTDLNAARDHYISTTFLAISLFLLAVQWGNRTNAEWYKKLCFIGSALSLNIYIVHPMIIKVMNKLISIVGGGSNTVSTVYHCIEPFFILAVSTVISWAIYVLSNKINEQKAAKK